ncbi:MULTISPECIES: DMT family transporter [unclassified Ruegeria]|uniref:DMT family transporter n=1 Tax=unclassified Ruegeria TaxID=2625375 RepID=UPI001492BD17|nr:MULTISPECIES: DMT family transporter [unclassified Ruegeria]NOD86650.1 EamA family transporter [Ruegeria sp. HKCCD6119]
MKMNRTALAYGALLLAMLISAGNFLFGNLAVSEVHPVVLTFWRCLIAAMFVFPLVMRGRSKPLQHFKRSWLRFTILACIGVVATPWFVYSALRSNDLIDLGAGYTSVPLLTILFSAFLLNERLRSVQYLGVIIALIGALVFAFRGDLENLFNFNPHLAFLLMITSNACRGLYLVLLKKWNMHPRPDEGLFVIFIVGIVVLLPFVVIHEAGTVQPLDYSWQVWGSILFIGVGMGAIYLHLLNFGTNEVGASTASLFAYLVPILVAVEAVALKGMDFQIYQGVGGVLIIGGVLIATRLHSRPAATDHPPH